MTQNEELAQVTNSYYSKDFEDVNEELRRHFQLANREIDHVKEKVNVLVDILHKDNKNWSIKKICEYIAGKNDDFEELGFSTKTIYNYLNEENRQLIDTRKHKRQKGDSARLRESPALKDFREQKGTVDFSCKPLHEKVPEESTRTLSPTTEDIEDLRGNETTTEVTYDSKFIDNLIKTSEKYEELKQKYIELETKYERVILTYQVKSIEVINNQELPIIMKANPYKRINRF